MCAVKRPETSFSHSRKDHLQGQANDDIFALIRIRSLENENRALRRHLALVEKSRSWKMTYPLRLVNALRAGMTPGGVMLRQAVGNLVEEGRDKGLLAGVVSLKSKIFRHRRKGADTLFEDNTAETERYYRQPLETVRGRFHPRFLIVAELRIPQCTKYRVTQKADFLQSLGWDVHIVDWADSRRIMAELQVASEVIFYRVPGYDEMLSLIAEARRLDLQPRWEVDDFIFDVNACRANSNLDTFDRKEARALLKGVELYRKSLLATGRGLASTPALAKGMQAAGIENVAIIENALDDETLALAADLSAQPRDEGGFVWVCYGSGTRTHDVDFRQAQAGLLAAMEEEPRLCLHIVGPLKISPQFERFGERVRRTESVPYASYLRLLASAHIAIAPLEKSSFNDAKSNIKYLEASIVGLPSICSPSAPFVQAIEDGETGYLAGNDATWRDRLLALARDSVLRRRIGEAARISVEGRYRPEVVTEAQVLPVYGRAPQVVCKDQPRVVMANVFFEPRSFGGSTIVIEALIDPLRKRGSDVSVLTTRPAVKGVVDAPLRYRVGETDVLAVVPGKHAAFANLELDEDLERWLEGWNGNIVHFHAIQELGVSMARACRRLGIPYVITLHDCWWLTDDLFIRDDDGRYRLDTPVAGRPKSRSTYEVYLEARRVAAYDVLMGAAKLLSPSEEHKAVHVRNGIPAERIAVNRNGFRWPARPRRRKPSAAPLRFAHVGGVSHVKGYDLIHEAFADLNRGDWELVIVDNTLNVGFSSVEMSDWNSMAGKVTIVPAYRQEELDAFYDGVDVLLFPSQWRESYGLSVREALSRDVWVIATTPGGQAEEIVEGVNGSLIPLDTKPEELRDAILALLERPETLVDYENPLKDRLPTYAQQAEELDALYREILNRKPDVGTC